VDDGLGAVGGTSAKLDRQNNLVQALLVRVDKCKTNEANESVQDRDRAGEWRRGVRGVWFWDKCDKISAHKVDD
jgi:hypothetical protein